MSLPSQTVSGDQSLGGSWKTSPRRTILRWGVWHLHSDGLLAGDRREDADVRGGQRIGEVVLELGNLAHLDAGRQAQLIARDVGPGDRPDHLGLDAEVTQRLYEGRCSDLLLPGRVGARLVRSSNGSAAAPRREAPQTKSGSSVTAPRSRPCGVRSAGIGRGATLRGSPPSSSLFPKLIPRPVPPCWGSVGLEAAGCTGDVFWPRRLFGLGLLVLSQRPRGRLHVRGANDQLSRARARAG